jgi:hypothetical protein
MEALRLIVLMTILNCICLAANSSQDTSAINNSDVVALVKSGLSSEVVIAKIKASHTKFDTSVAALQEMKKMEVPDSVILVMIESGSEINTAKEKTPAISGKLRETPRIYIEAHQGDSTSVDFWNGLHTDNDLNTVSEIARMLTERSQTDGVPMEVVFERDKADLVWLLGREKKWNSKMYTWNLIDRTTGQSWAYGRENWFRNAVKDTVKFVKVTWGMKKAGMEAGELGKKYPVKITLPKKIKKGKSKDNVAKVLVTGTPNKTTVKIISQNPDIATFADGSFEFFVDTKGGDENSAEIGLIGTGKKGMCYFTAFVAAVQ